MQIEVGKSYRTREGKKVEIVRANNGSDYKFSGEFRDGSSRKTDFTANGSYYAHGKQDVDDLIAPWEEPLKLEAGKYYRTRAGEKAFVIGKNPFPGAPSDDEFCGYIYSPDPLDSTPAAWGDMGLYFYGETHAEDLIAPWVDEPEQITLPATLHPDGKIIVDFSALDNTRKLRAVFLNCFGRVVFEDWESVL